MNLAHDMGANPTADARSFKFLDESQTLHHPRLDEIFSLAYEAIFAPDDTSMLQIIGPTAAGKTHLTRFLRSKLAERFAEEMKEDPQFLPFVYFPARLLSDKLFSWTAHYQDCLTALLHPHPSFRSLGEARDKIASAFRARRTKLVIVDEAHHILTGCGEDKVRAQSEVLKSLCQETGTKHLLVGTYDLTRCLRTNGQFARRSRVLHFMRYRNTPEDRALFTSVLGAIDRESEGHLDVRLADYDEMVFQGCAGLIGILRIWLVRALHNAQEERETRITPDALLATRFSTLDLIKIVQEAKKGEEFLLETDDNRAAFATLLNEDQSIVPSSTTTFIQKSPRRTNRLPGRRNPHRDPVGLPK